MPVVVAVMVVLVVVVPTHACNMEQQCSSQYRVGFKLSQGQLGLLGLLLLLLTAMADPVSIVRYSSIKQQEKRLPPPLLLLLISSSTS